MGEGEGRGMGGRNLHYKFIFYDVKVADGGHLGWAHVVSYVILLGLFYPLNRDREVVLKRR